MVNKKLLVEGKTNNVYEIEEGKVLIEYKDIAKAYSGVKVASINGKGIVTNKISEIIMQIARERDYELIDVHAATIENPSWFVEDGMHFNEDGAKGVAKLIYQEIISNEDKR